MLRKPLTVLSLTSITVVSTFFPLSEVQAQETQAQQESNFFTEFVYILRQHGQTRLINVLGDDQVLHLGYYACGMMSKGHSLQEILQGLANDSSTIGSDQAITGSAAAIAASDQLCPQ